MVTPKGTISAEIVVNAGGLWAREVGRMVGLELPVLPMEHHYLITERSAGDRERAPEELPHAIDYEGEIYIRQEGKGMLLGTYERPACPGRRGTPMDFGHELLPPDLDRIAPRLEVAFQRFPALGRGRHQAHHQRPVHLRARRQPAGRPGAAACGTTGSPAASWRASARAAASAWRWPTG